MSSSWADQTDAELEEVASKPPVNMWSKGNPLVKTTAAAETKSNNTSTYDYDYPEVSKERQSPRNAPQSRDYPENKSYEREEYSRDARDDRRYSSNYDRDNRDYRDSRDSRDERGYRDSRDYRDSYGRDSYYSRGRGGRDRDSRRDYRDSDHGRRDRPSYNFDRRPPRDTPDAPRTPLPVPTSPPYTAFVGNLPFGVIEADVAKFFGEDVISVRLPLNKDRRIKGFGYVEFATQEALKKALERNGELLFDREVRIDVASTKEERPARASSFSSARPRDRYNDAPPAADAKAAPAAESKPEEGTGSASPERRKLELKPRSDPTPIQQPSLSDAYKNSKVNPFGNAKPRDEREYLKRKEEEQQKAAATNSNAAAPSTASTASPSPSAPAASANKASPSAENNTKRADKPAAVKGAADRNTSDRRSTAANGAARSSKPASFRDRDDSRRRDSRDSRDRDFRKNRDTRDTRDSRRDEHRAPTAKKEDRERPPRAAPQDNKPKEAPATVTSNIFAALGDEDE